MIIEKTYWRDASGFKWDVKDMQEDHLLNSMAYIADKMSKYDNVNATSVLRTATNTLFKEKLEDMRKQIGILDEEIARRAAEKLDSKS